MNYIVRDLGGGGGNLINKRSLPQILRYKLRGPRNLSLLKKKGAVTYGWNLNLISSIGLLKIFQFFVEFKLGHS